MRVVTFYVSDPDTPSSIFMPASGHQRRSDCAPITFSHRLASDAPQRRGCRGIATACALNRRAKSSGPKTKIGRPTQLRVCLFGRDVSVGLRDVVDARVAVVDGEQSGIGRRIHMNGRRV